MSSTSALFRRPLLIYDDRCHSCTKFARFASGLSRGWIRIAGHYYSPEAKQAKDAIFPPGYDPTRMFWLVNRSGAYGARSGLSQVAKEIAFGIFAGGSGEGSAASPACEYRAGEMSCFSSTGVLRRIAGLLRYGATFRF